MASSMSFIASRRQQTGQNILTRPSGSPTTLNTPTAIRRVRFEVHGPNYKFVLAFAFVPSTPKQHRHTQPHTLAHTLKSLPAPRSAGESIQQCRAVCWRRVCQFIVYLSGTFVRSACANCLNASVCWLRVAAKISPHTWRVSGPVGVGVGRRPSRWWPARRTI